MSDRVGTAQSYQKRSGTRCQSSKDFTFSWKIGSVRLPRPGWICRRVLYRHSQSPSVPHGVPLGVDLVIEQKTAAATSQMAFIRPKWYGPWAVKAVAQAGRPWLPFKLNIPEQLLGEEWISPEPVVWNRVCTISHAKLDCGLSEILESSVLRKQKREHSMMVSPNRGFLFAFWREEYRQGLV